MDKQNRQPRGEGVSEHVSKTDEDNELEAFGYKAELKRTLNPWAVFGIAFSFQTAAVPLISPVAVSTARPAGSPLAP